MFNVDKAIEKTEEIIEKFGPAWWLTAVKQILLAGRECDPPNDQRENSLRHLMMAKRIGVLEDKLGSGHPKKELMRKIEALEKRVTELEKPVIESKPEKEFVKIPLHVWAYWIEHKSVKGYSPIDRYLSTSV